MNLKSIVAWNIRQGGTKHSREIVAELAELNDDVIVLTEFRNNPAGSQIKARLAERGYSISHSPSAVSENSVLIASRDSIIASYPLDPELPEPRRLWAVELGWLRLCGVYIAPNATKLPYWEALHRAAIDEKGPELFIGDFNTGNDLLDRTGGTAFTAAKQFDDFGKGRFCDVWRTKYPEGREYTWYSKAKNGFRLDHVFATQSILDRIARCEYLHDTREREISDHSALRIEIALVDAEGIATVPQPSAVVSI